MSCVTLQTHPGPAVEAVDVECRHHAAFAAEYTEWPISQKRPFGSPFSVSLP